MEMWISLHNKHEPYQSSLAVSIDDPYECYEENLEILELIRAGSVTERDCVVDRVESPCQALKRLEGTEVNYDELDYLARLLDGFNRAELEKYEAAAHLLDKHGIEDLINLSFCCQEATVITDFNDLKATGINHYLTVNGGASAEEVKRLDGEQLARDLIATGQGRVTPYGVIFPNAMRLEPHYTGQNFPPYLDVDCIMEISLMPPPSHSEDSQGATLFLPMSEQRLDRTLERAGLRTLDDVKIQHWIIELPSELERWINVPKDGLENLNRFCNQLSQLDDAGRRKLEAVAAFAVPDSANALRYLAENLDQFDFVPDVKTAEDYGRYMIQKSGLFSYDPSLEECYNYEKYGEERITHEEGRFVEQGYVSYHGGMALDELMRDDPAEMEQQMGGMA